MVEVSHGCRGEEEPAQASAAGLSSDKQWALWRRFLKERRYCQPSRFSRLVVMDVLSAIRSRFLKRMSAFLDEDYRAEPGKSYPYPAMLPGFLARVGLHEARRWPRVAKERKALFAELLAVAEQSEIRPYLPKAYFNPRLSIVPLRFVWLQPNGASMRKGCPASFMLPGRGSCNPSSRHLSHWRALVTSMAPAPSLNASALGW